MAPSDLARLLGRIPTVHDENVLIGEQTVDDAGVYRLAPDLALVQTVDFFPPVIDDPYWYGRIAAANAFSDVWAMGARALTALNLVGFPDDRLDVGVLAEILRGGAEAAEEAGVSVIGGHTMRDDEIKYGMAVTGLAHPGRVVTNAGARPGQRLLLTKPLGSGVLTTALRVETLPPELLERLTRMMASLNRPASECMLRHGAAAATDITGYGLAGHALEMARASGVTLAFDAGAVPVLPEAVDYCREGYLPAGSYANKRFFSPHAAMDPYLPDEMADLFYDAQTSGGLLAALPADRADACLAEMRQGGVEAAAVGEVRPHDGKFLRFVV